MLAVLLAICNVGGANATKDATHANIAASDTWAFFQAKNIRRAATTLAANELELLLAAQPGMPDDAKRKFEDKIKDYRAEVQRLSTDSTKKEGLEELFAKAKGLEGDRDIALRKDPYFDWSQALLQIAIVLASVHLIIGNLWLLSLSGGWEHSGCFSCSTASPGCPTALCRLAAPCGAGRGKPSPCSIAPY